MKRLLSFLLIPASALSQSWMRLPDFPATKRDDGIGVVVNNNAYFGTGLQEWNATIDFGVLNLSTLTWTSMPAMPNTTERQYACGFKGTNCFYIFGGTGQGGVLNTLFKYDIITSTWTEMSPKPGAGLVAAAVFEFGNKVIISNGKYNNNKPSYEVWEYDLTLDKWTAKNKFPAAPVWRSSYATANGNGYMICGVDSLAKLRKELFRYTPGTDTWLVIDSFPGPGRAYAAMQAFDQRLFVFGGMDSVQPYHSDLRSFDLVANTWHTLPSIPGVDRRGGMSCASANNLYYTCGLSSIGRLTETWRTDLPTSLHEYTKPELVVFPNPFKTSLYFAPSLDPVQTAEIFTAAGISVIKKEVTGNVLELPEIPIGIYLLKVQTASGRILTNKIIHE